MTQTYYTLLTKVGAAELTNAQALGKHVPITHIAVGDGAGNAVQPTEAMQTLTREVHRTPISSVSVDEQNPSWLIVEAVIPADLGGWTVREIGLIGGTGAGNKLLAVGNFPASYKPQLTEGVARDMVIRMIIQLSNTSVVNLLVDPSVALATAKTLETAIKAHQADAHAHDIYLPLSGGTLTGPVHLPSTTVFSTGLKMHNTRDVGEYFVPPGTVAFFAMTTLPPGWIKANGAQISRIAYAELFAAIGTSFGGGDGSSTFNLPDLRGEFIRGVDDGRGIDTGRSLGSSQTDSFRAHEHSARQALGLSGTTGSHSLVAHTNTAVGSSLQSGAVSTVGGSETRPRNVALVAAIKH